MAAAATTTQMLIGLYSPAPRSGKTTIANVLVRDYGFTRIGFSDALKAMADTLLRRMRIGNADLAFYKDAGKMEPIPEVGGVSYRHLTQTLGTEWGRGEIHDNLWLNPVILPYRAAPMKLVVDDLRFPNEYEAILAEGGEAWRVARPSAKLPNGHPSEGLLEGKDFDAYLFNDERVSHLEKHVHRLMQGGV